MRLLGSIFDSIFHAKKRRNQRRVRYERVAEFPECLRPSTLYVAGEEPYVWAAAMICPCGCGETIHLNLLDEESPCWSVRVYRGRSVSVRPSVWRTKGCRSHFVIYKGQIEWWHLDTTETSGCVGRR